MRTVYVALTWKESVRPKIYSQSTRYLLFFSSPQDTPTKVRTQMASPSTESSTERARCAAPNWAANCPLLSSAFLQTSFPPFLRPTKLTLPETSGVPDFIRQFHSSVASATQRCVALLQMFASQNPFLNRLSSLSAHFGQIHCRKQRNLNPLSNQNFAAILPGDSVAGIVVANGILNFLNIYNTLLIVRLVLTWFPNSPPAIVSPLSTLCDPYLNIFRGIIPPLGGTLDLSPILAFLVLNAFTSTAAALPAELPMAGVPQQIPSSHTRLFDLTTTQKKWMRRLCGNRSKSSGSVN
ncbi:ylmG homolog protein 2, chloroplastic [Vitis riparia]|uniref:ylmG homolog protein 2, chloroplastic n=1 Tax=Vitis riparia TaxID=96939 RepID=UPI00155A604D|nr:ylmG homolog protein 2, chloroplastic [Vitis riparia]